MSKRVVIVGGGFAGVSAAQELTRRLKRERRRSRPDAPLADGIEVLLLNRDNYFVFQPLLADIISGTIEPPHVVAPLRRMLPDCQVEVGYVAAIDAANKAVTLTRRLSGVATAIEYDALIIAIGSVTDLDMVAGMAEHAVGIRTLGDAFYLRNRALDMLEEARIETDAARREELLTFVVIGGGSTGVQGAAELKDLVELAGRSFRDVRLEPRVVLVHSQSTVLSELGDRLGRYATKKLRAARIDLRLGRRVKRVNVDRVELDDGTSISAATVVSTVGNAPNPVIAGIPTARDRRGWPTPEAT